MNTHNAAYNGQYADALSKGVGVSLLVAETTGALAASFMTILRLLARQTRLPGATDNISRRVPPQLPHAPRCQHLLNAAILNAASARILRVSYGVT